MFMSMVDPSSVDGRLFPDKTNYLYAEILSSYLYSSDYQFTGFLRSGNQGQCMYWESDLTERLILEQLRMYYRPSTATYGTQFSFSDGVKAVYPDFVGTNGIITVNADAPIDMGPRYKGNVDTLTWSSYFGAKNQSSLWSKYFSSNVTGSGLLLKVLFELT